MLNNNINGCSGMVNTPDSHNAPAIQNHFAGKGINLIANPQFVPDDIDDILNQEGEQIIGHASSSENVFIDKGTTSADGYLECMMTFILRKVYINAEHKTSYGHNIIDVDSFLGFDHRLINRNNVDLIIIDNADLKSVGFFIYLDQLLRFENQTNEPFNGVQFVVIGNMYNSPKPPEGFNAPNLLNSNHNDNTRRDKLETLHVGLHVSYLELWALAGFIVFT